MMPCGYGEVLRRRSSPDGVGDAEQDAEDDQHDRGDPEGAQRRLDLVLEEQAEDTIGTCR